MGTNERPGPGWTARRKISLCNIWKMAPLTALPDQKRMESTSDFRVLSDSHMFVKAITPLLLGC
jgi:hypothetical protein